MISISSGIDRQNYWKFDTELGLRAEYVTIRSQTRISSPRITTTQPREEISIHVKNSITYDYWSRTERCLRSKKYKRCIICTQLILYIMRKICRVDIDRDWRYGCKSFIHSIELRVNRQIRHFVFPLRCSGCWLIAGTSLDIEYIFSTISGTTLPINWSENIFTLSLFKGDFKKQNSKYIIGGLLS